jgi:acyl-CoA dehydrogenase
VNADTLEDVLASVRRFVRERVVPREEEIAATDAVPDDLRHDAAEMGLFGFTLPTEYGGIGMNAAEEARLCLELGYTSPAFRSLFGTNNGIGGQSIVLSGTEAQKLRYLPRLASGELIVAFALTEPEAGSDAAALTTRAEPDGDDWVITGTKRFITNAPIAGLFVVYARTGVRDAGPRGISAFLVEAGAPGLSVGPKDKKMGQSGAQTADVMLDGVRVGAAAMLGGAEGGGFATAMRALDRGRLHIAALCAGTAQRLIDESVAYARQRIQFGRAISDFQLVQGMLADSQAEAYAGRAMVLDAAARRDAGANVTMEAACAKYFCSEMVGRVADRAVQIHGGAGYMRDSAVERFYRDVRLFRIYEGTNQIQQLVIARQLVKAYDGSPGPGRAG